MENKIEFILGSVKNKDEVKATTTLQFKKDVSDILGNSEFDGDILEIGTSSGYTTSILCAIAELKDKYVYSFEHNLANVYEARQKCFEYGFSNYSIIQKDVYREEWGDDVSKGTIGCVFIDCVHTKKCFALDLENAKNITSGIASPIIIAHDYGLVTKEGDGIKAVLDENQDKYEIVRYLGEKDNWNELGSGTVIDWEGIQLKFHE